MRLGADVIVFSRASRTRYFFFLFFMDAADFHIVEVGYIWYLPNCLKCCVTILFIYIQFKIFDWVWKFIQIFFTHFLLMPFSRATQSIGLLSYTFLRRTGQDDVIVPMVILFVLSIKLFFWALAFYPSVHLISIFTSPVGWFWHLWPLGWTNNIQL